MSTTKKYDFTQDEIPPDSCVVLKDESNVSIWVSLEVPDNGLDSEGLLYNKRTNDLRITKIGCLGGKQDVLVEPNFGGTKSKPYLRGDKLFVIMRVMNNE